MVVPVLLATERGRTGYDKYRHDFAFDNPDHVSIVIDSYGWRLGLAEGESKYYDLEKRLAEGPVITVPTITLEGDANGAPHPDASSYAKKFSGKYALKQQRGRRKRWS